LAWRVRRWAGAGAPIDVETKDAILAGYERRSCRDGQRPLWHHLRQQEPASEAVDPGFQDKLVDRLREMTGVELPRS
jgi:hypothetical protein